MCALNIARIDPTSLRDTVYQELRGAFTRGEFGPGDQVSLRTLADMLGTSMTPVREAVRRLVAEGALVDMPNRSLMVPPLDTARIRELKSARETLEALALDLSMDRMDPALIDRLEAILATPQGPEPDLQQNYDFHLTLYRQSQSTVILPLIEALWLQYGACLHLVMQHEDARQIAQHTHHVEIIAALRAGARDAAQTALRQDIARSFRVLLPEDKT
ncbi:MULTISPECIES: GntR family transcriptional regulator [unclassified Dinoroseobacter]|uniref:GntR family transcriptional regulator n=1 Tax=unclassified Dinoroseobacter TaxID=2620028 RepID=UPI003C7D15FC